MARRVPKTSKGSKKRSNILRSPKAIARLHVSAGACIPCGMSLFGLHHGYQQAGDFIIIKCKDGGIACVVKDIDKAFPLYAQQFSSKIDSLLDLMKVKFQGQVDMDHNIVPIYKNLDSLNGDAAINYRAAYVKFATNPCSEKNIEGLSYREWEDCRGHSHTSCDGIRITEGYPRDR